MEEEDQLIKFNSMDLVDPPFENFKGAIFVGDIIAAESVAGLSNKKFKKGKIILEQFLPVQRKPILIIRKIKF